MFCINSLYRKDQCQSPDPPASSFIPSFAAVAAGVDKNMDKEAHGKCLVSLRYYLKKYTWTCVFTTVPFSSDRSIFAWIQIQHHWSSVLHTSASRPLGVQQVGVNDLKSSAAVFFCSIRLLDQSLIFFFSPFTLSGLLGVVPPVIAAPTPIVMRGTT